MPPTAQDDRGKITFYYHLMNQEQCLEKAQGDAGIGAQAASTPLRFDPEQTQALDASAMGEGTEIHYQVLLLQ